MTKLTKKIALTAAITALNANENKEWRMAGTEDAFATSEIVDKLLAMIAQLDATISASKKPTKNQQENEAFKELILEVLRETNEKLTITKLMSKHETLAAMSNQKVAALIRQLVKEGKIERIEEGRKAYFKA